MSHIIRHRAFHHIVNLGVRTRERTSDELTPKRQFIVEEKVVGSDLYFATD